jgi:polyisoprenoid-binding protein YceI
VNQRTVFVLVSLLGVLGLATAARADDYAIDPAHSSVAFKISHLGLSWTHGRFNDATGTFVIDAEPAKCAFNLTIKADSIDTGNGMRDTHLRNADFFDTAKFPTITFKSTAVEMVKDGYKVTGDFTMHGVTKPITFNLIGGRTGEFPKGVTRIGFSTETVLKRSAYGMDKFAEAVGDDVYVAISFEGVKK